MNGDWVSDDGDDAAFSVGGVWQFACLRIDLYWRYLFRLENVPARQWMGSMSELNVLIEQMAVDISTQATRLDNLRLRLFLNWFLAHNNEMREVTEATIQMDIAILREANLEGRFQSALKTWLASLTIQGLLWEYHLIMDEIAWWRDLDSRRLNMILSPEENN